MSVTASTWAWKIVGLHPTEKLALLALADWSDDEGVSFPSLNKLAAKVETSRRNISRVIRKLEAKGLLRVQKRPAPDGDNYSNQYHLEMADQIGPAEEGGSDTHVTRGSDTHVTRGSDTAVSPYTSLPDTSLPDTPPNPQGVISEIRAIFAYWQEILSHPRARLDADRERRIRKALKTFTADELRLAIIGITHSEWHMGRHPDNGKRFDDISNVFKNAKQIETFIELATKHGQPSAVAHTTSKRRVLG